MFQDNFAFAVKTEMREGPLPVSIVEYICDRCPQTWKEILKSGTKINPEHIAKRARRDGWVAPTYRGKARCPECQNQKKAAPDMSETTMLPKPNTGTKVELRDPTPSEKLKIRTLLDTHFDDSKGMYLNGYSDQKVGEELNIPWAMVTKLREVAYGPIRVDPEIAEMQSELNKIRSEFKVAQEKLEASYLKNIEDASTRLSSIESKLNGLAKQRKDGK